MSKRWLDRKANEEMCKLFKPSASSDKTAESFESFDSSIAHDATGFFDHEPLSSLLLSENDISENESNFTLQDPVKENLEIPRESKGADVKIKNSLPEDIVLYAMKYSLPQKGIQEMLDMLNKHNISVPRTVFMLRKESPRVSVDDYIVTKDFAYLTIQENLTFAEEKGLLQDEIRLNGDKEYIDIQINIDGLPLFKSSQISLWPILVKFSQKSYPFPVAVYCGVGKPNLEIYLRSLLRELETFKLHGLVCNKGRKIFLGGVTFICDAPARAFLQCIKGHSGFYGCGYCRNHGKYIEDRVVFPSIDFEKRNDDDYREFRESNQISLSPLAAIVPLYSSFPPEYMHLVCLGVVRKLFNYYFSYTKGQRLPCRLSSTQKQQINNDILCLRAFTPCEFQRKPRSLSDLQYFKASEFRAFLLYFGPIVFRKYLDGKYYSHFLKLHFAVTVFSSNEFKSFYNHAFQCLRLFVYEMKELFGEQSMSYNVHVLLHLYDFVEMNGPLDRFSSFPFESYFYLLKRKIKASNCVFKQTVNQLFEVRSLYANKARSISHYTNKSPNNCCIIDDGRIVLIKEASENYQSGFVLKLHDNLYKTPYDSKHLNIGIYKVTDQFLSNIIPLKKCLCIPDDKYFVVFPLVGEI